jgi:signal transduction histidine kinase
VIQDAVDLIRYQLSKNCIVLEMNIAEELPAIFGHHQQLQQVFLNLFSNARFALNQRFSGKDPRKKIIISGEVVELDGREYVRIVFQDMGIGIRKDKVGKIFEPFFSSKTQGEGTGLGLSISREIITKHGGILHVESQEGEYTRMIVDLPVCQGHEENASNTSSAGRIHD